MINGVINVYKEKGYTSHDVVAKLRGILRQKKIGHTGTLDPEAEGVLPVCLGKATKLCELLTDKTKTYEAVLQLGIVTDTQDMTGKVLEEHPVSVTDEEAERTILSFLGDQEQIPPMYSALKVNGRKLYELAREGKEVERKPRKVTLYEIKATAGGPAVEPAGGTVREHRQTRHPGEWYAICVTFDTDAIHVSASDTITPDDTRLGLDRYQTIIETHVGTFQTHTEQAHWQLEAGIPIDGGR